MNKEIWEVRDIYLKWIYETIRDNLDKIDDELSSEDLKKLISQLKKNKPFEGAVNLMLISQFEESIALKEFEEERGKGTLQEFIQ